MIKRGITLMAGTLSFCALTLLSASETDEPQMIVGTTVHFTWSKGISADENVSLLAQGGIISPRGDIHWEDCEKSKGVMKMPGRCREFVEKSFSMGLSPLILIDYGNPLYDGGGYPKSKEAVEAFARYCEFVAGEFKGKCRLYQIWNEWEGVCMPAQFHGQGDPGSYIKLLEVVYPRIKAIDPSAKVVCNSICKGEDYLKKLLGLGLLKNCDMVAMNMYGGTPEDWCERMSGIDKLLRESNDGRAFPFIITEISWATHIPQGGRAEEESADYLGRLFLLGKTLPFHCCPR